MWFTSRLLAARRRGTENERRGKHASYHGGCWDPAPGLTKPNAVEQLKRRGMRVRAERSLPCVAGSSVIEKRDTERDDKLQGQMGLLTVWPREGRGLGAARLEGFGGFGRGGRRLWLRALSIAPRTMRAGAALCGFRGNLIRAGRWDQQKTTPPLRQRQEEGSAENQTSHEAAHTIILRRIGKKSPSSTEECRRAVTVLARRN
jgi:hypothetical protein